MVNPISQKSQAIEKNSLSAQSAQFKNIAQLPTSTQSQPVSIPVPGTVPTNAAQLNTPSSSEQLIQRLKGSQAPTTAASKKSGSNVSVSVRAGFGGSSNGIIEKNIGATVSGKVGTVGLSFSVDQRWNDGKLKGKDVSNSYTDFTLGASAPLGKDTPLGRNAKVSASILAEHYDDGGSGNFFSGGIKLSKKFPIDSKTSITAQVGTSIASDNFKNNAPTNTMRFDMKLSVDTAVLPHVSVGAFVADRERIGLNEGGDTAAKATPRFTGVGLSANWDVDSKTSLNLMAGHTFIGKKSGVSSDPNGGAFGLSAGQGENVVILQVERKL